MVVIAKNDAHYLDRAIEEVTKVLTQKRQDWATGMEVFECFDAQKDFGDDPLEFAIKMCNLKITRLKSCVERRQKARKQSPDPLGENAIERDLEDTIKDLAGYALLALGLYKREQGKTPQVEKGHLALDSCDCKPTKEDPLLQFCPHQRKRTEQMHLDMLKVEFERAKAEREQRQKEAR